MTDELKSMLGGNITAAQPAQDAAALVDKQTKEDEEKKIKDFVKRQSTYSYVVYNVYSWNET
jgi:hypothetical protein